MTGGVTVTVQNTSDHSERTAFSRCKDDELTAAEDTPSYVVNAAGTPIIISSDS